MQRPIQLRQFTPEETYLDVYALQKDLLEKRIHGLIPDTLLLGEHAHVFTLGRASHEANLLEPGDIPIIEIERGGDITYHGPGQLVGYPILLLQDGERNLHQYLRRVEDVLILTLEEFGLTGSRNPGWTGVWVGEHKIASIGVAVKKWVTYHGFALNVSTNLAYFERINPCGLPSQTMTSMVDLLGKPIALYDLEQVLLRAFQHVFQRAF